ncbi:hypothetical protein M427DRAFT_155371 [Gonapodya prolifera JEL478]|uniref:Uncharacterized protein n=1 Tax=Gonapodya prolifera (strain JEL478) TaxID=1344416 RepID=A0A139AFG9_GONPJ|nr:hypothetical protein M427DRAFT_155371 [Gonapodya prolifera JEL478]|eukprot:KXS15439.1 hypothetical protein M427DRAFT_155371 [Gonapodya prolifera JEL478]
MEHYYDHDHEHDHKRKILMANADPDTLRQVLARSFAEIIALRTILVEEQRAREEAERGLEEAEVLANDLRRRVEGLEEAVWKAGLGGSVGVGECDGMDLGGPNEGQGQQVQDGNVHLPSPKESTGFGFHEEVDWATHPLAQAQSHAQSHPHTPQPNPHPHAHPTHPHAPSTAPTQPPSYPSSPNHPLPPAPPPAPPSTPTPTCPNCAIYRSAVDKAAYNDTWLRTALGHDLSYIHDATSRAERAAKEAREILDGMLGRLGVSCQPGCGVLPPKLPAPAPLPVPAPAPTQVMYAPVNMARDVGSDMWDEVYGHVRQENANAGSAVAATPMQY